MANYFMHGGGFNGRDSAPSRTEVGIRGDLVQVSSEHWSIPIYSLDNYPLGFGRVDLMGTPIIGEGQEIKTYYVGSQRWTMISADGEEHDPFMFRFSQKLNCEKRREEGYPYELCFYLLGEKRDATQAFSKLRKRGELAKGNGLWVPVKARNYR